MSQREAIVRNEHSSSVDFAAIAEHPEEQFAQYLIGSREERASRKGVCFTINQKIPKGESGEEVEFHSHKRDQIFYVLSGELMVQIEGEEPFLAQHGDMVTHPAGVMHRNWVTGTELVSHLQINGDELL